MFRRVRGELLIIVVNAHYLVIRHPHLRAPRVLRPHCDLYLRVLRITAAGFFWF
jgi:hypothetical protein